MHRLEKKVQADLDDDQCEKYFCVYYDSAYYWGKALHMFSFDPDSPVDEVEFRFLHPKMGGYSDWPRNEPSQKISAKFIFHGPCMPDLNRKGFIIEDEERVKILYRMMRKHLKPLNNLS